MQKEKATINQNSTQIQKKKPGRPRKQIVTIPVEAHGIVDSPCDPEDLLELVYCNPILFKKLLQLYKAFEASEIEIIFDPTHVHIFVKDHLGKSNITTIIDGRCLNLYYCKSTIKICVRRENLERILSTLGKSHYKITFVLRENYRSTMYIIIKDIDYNNEDSYEIDIMFKPEESAIVNARDDDTDYPIKFKMSRKHFKNKIGNIRKMMSAVFTIQKCGDSPLQFTFDKAQKVNWTGIYNEPGKIELQSTIKPDDVFNVSVYIEYILPFANSNIGDDIYIAADKHKRISFTTFLDKKEIGWTATIKVFTDIKDYKQN